MSARKILIVNGTRRAVASKLVTITPGRGWQAGPTEVSSKEETEGLEIRNSFWFTKVSINCDCPTEAVKSRRVNRFMYARHSNLQACRRLMIPTDGNETFIEIFPGMKPQNIDITNPDNKKRKTTTSIYRYRFEPRQSGKAGARREKIQLRAKRRRTHIEKIFHEDKFLKSRKRGKISLEVINSEVIANARNANYIFRMKPGGSGSGKKGQRQNQDQPRASNRFRLVNEGELSPEGQDQDQPMETTFTGQGKGRTPPSGEKVSAKRGKTDHTLIDEDRLLSSDVEDNERSLNGSALPWGKTAEEIRNEQRAYMENQREAALARDARILI